VVAFIIVHVTCRTNAYVLRTHLLELAPLALLSLLIPRRYKDYYFVFLLYYFLTTSLTFNNWIVALPNYMARENVVWGLTALAFAFISLVFGRSLRKALMLGSFLSGVAYYFIKDGLLLVLHLSFALSFIIALFADLHFIVWSVNYITYALRRLQGTV